MKTENTTIKLSGTVTDEAWSGKQYGKDLTQFIHCSRTHETHDICELLRDSFAGKEVIITISETNSQ
jgi:hypothetical protein